MRFVHETLAQRVRFAPDDARPALTDEVDRLGARRVMVIAEEAAAELACRITADVPAIRHYSEVVMHVPTDVADRARAAAVDCRADALVSVGGGSTTGLAKAIALTTGLPIVAVPTTYAGSEATAVWGLTEGGRKSTGTDPIVLPRAVVYDAALLRTLPTGLAMASGLNAMAHCVDSLWAPLADPLNRLFALDGARALAHGLPEVLDAPQGLVGIETALYGAYLAAVAFASAGSGLHHKICHVLGGAFDLPHAQTHAVVLPYVLALNQPNARQTDERLAAAFRAPSALAGLQTLRAALNAPRALRDYGFKVTDIPAAVEAIMPVVPPSNPTLVTPENLSALLRAAWEGSETG